MRVRVKFAYKDPYTWKLVRVDKVIGIDSEEAAIKWVKQSYGRVWNVITEVIDGK